VFRIILPKLRLAKDPALDIPPLSSRSRKRVCDKPRLSQPRTMQCIALPGSAEHKEWKGCSALGGPKLHSVHALMNDCCQVPVPIPSPHVHPEPRPQPALVRIRLSRASLAARRALSLGAIAMAPSGHGGPRDRARKKDLALDADGRGPLS
jgi:hypothetical protein